MPVRRAFLTRFARILLAGSSLCAQPSSLAQEPLQVIAFEYPPFVMQGAQGVVAGYGLEVMRLLNPGRSVQVIVHPLARAKIELDNGTYLIGMGTRNHHADLVKQGQILPVQVGALQFVFFYSKHHFAKPPQHSALEEFRQYRICAQQDSAASSTMQKAGITLDTSADLPSLFRKVAAGRCDLGLAINLSIAASLANDAQAAHFGVVNFAVMEIPMDLLINAQYKDAHKLAHDWQAGTEKLIHDGTLPKLAEKMMGTTKIPEGFFRQERKGDDGETAR